MHIKVNPIIDHSVRCLCIRPYPGHKKGCPNFNHKNGCPPGAPLFEDVYDLTKPIFAIVNKFNLSEHREKMRAANPSWSPRQLDCCLYWQPKARKQLMIKIKYFLQEHPGYNVTACPEAMGVEITKTLAPAGIILEWPPSNFTYQVALAGIYRKCRICGCTWFNGCQGGCSWIENDLCSSCI
jgi:predicted metal-binding protein